MVKFAAGEGADFVVLKPEEFTYTTGMPYVRQALSDLADRWGAKVDQDGLRIEITDEMKLSVPEGTNLSGLRPEILLIQLGQGKRCLNLLAPQAK